MASKLLATASNLEEEKKEEDFKRPTGDGLQATSDGLQPRRRRRRKKKKTLSDLVGMASKLLAMASNLEE